MRKATARRRNERGAALVEFTIVLPLFLALVLGLVTFGTVYSQKLAMTNAAREGARYGATLPVDSVGSVGAWLANVADVTKGSADGELDDDVPGRIICVALNDGSGWQGSQCFSDGRPADEARVQVEVQRTGELEVFFFKSNITLTGKAVARFEPAMSP